MTPRNIGRAVLDLILTSPKGHRKIGQAVMLDLSTAHWPDEHALQRMLDFGDQGPRVVEHEYGGIVFVSGGPAGEMDVTGMKPEDLVGSTQVPKRLLRRWVSTWSRAAQEHSAPTRGQATGVPLGSAADVSPAVADLVEEGIPKWLCPIYQEALRRGAVLINFDQDAPAVDAFQKYEW